MVRVAELHIKRITSVDWNDQNIVNKLYALFLGDKLFKKQVMMNMSYLLYSNQIKIIYL